MKLDISGLLNEYMSDLDELVGDDATKWYFKIYIDILNKNLIN